MILVSHLESRGDFEKMTGIEKLRALAYKKNFLEPAEAREIDAIADQIVRETQPKRDPAADVSMSAYDLLPQEDRDAIAWVREHGGLDQVKMDYDMYEGFSSLVDRVAARLGVSVEGLDAQDADPIVTSALDRRLMPEGMEWPRFEDGEPVRIGDTAPFGSDDAMEVTGVELNRFGYVLHGSINNGMRDCVDGDEHGAAVKRPMPKVLDADGVEIEVGDDLYSVEGSLKFHVSHVDRINGKIATYAMFSLDKWADPAMYTHRAPVIADDGKPLREGETVWHKRTGRAATVKGFDRMLGEPCAVIDFAGIEQRVSGALLTHEQPRNATDEERESGDLVRRARALAERGM